MAQWRCNRCCGTGWASAARDSGTENAHWSQVQFGVYKCQKCGGSGKLGLTDYEEESISKAVERMNSNYTL